MRLSRWELGRTASRSTRMRSGSRTSSTERCRASTPYPAPSRADPRRRRPGCPRRRRPVAVGRQRAGAIGEPDRHIDRRRAHRHRCRGRSRRAGQRRSIRLGRRGALGHRRAYRSAQLRGPPLPHRQLARRAFRRRFVALRRGADVQVHHAHGWHPEGRRYLSARDIDWYRSGERLRLLDPRAAAVRLRRAGALPSGGRPCRRHPGAEPRGPHADGLRRRADIHVRATEWYSLLHRPCRHRKRSRPWIPARVHGQRRRQSGAVPPRGRRRHLPRASHPVRPAPGRDRRRHPGPADHPPDGPRSRTSWASSPTSSTRRRPAPRTRN